MTTPFSTRPDSLETTAPYKFSLLNRTKNKSASEAKFVINFDYTNA